MRKWVSSGTLTNIWTIPWSEGGLDADTLAWIAAVVANGGSVSAGRQTLVNNLIVGLKADGIWTKLDRLWLFAAEDQPSALTDLVADASATAVNSPTFNVNLGYTGDRVNSKYVDTNYPANTVGNYVQDSACLFAWSNTSGTDGASLFGYDTLTRIFPQYTDNNTYWDINDFANNPANVGLGGTGLYLANRTGANASSLDLNGNEQYTSVQVSNILPGGGPTFQAPNVAGGGAGGGFRQTCCIGFGAGLTVTERANIYSRLRTYMTAVGVP